MSEAAHKLHRETEAAKVLRAQIADLIAGDEECAADMVEAETNLDEAIDAAVRQLVGDLASLRGLNAMIDDLGKRRDRIKLRVENMRTALAVAMEQAGKKKVEHPAVTLSLRNKPASVVAVDESLIPAKFWRPSEPTLDKKSLLEALKAKEQIPGAALSNGGQSISLSWS